MTKRFSPSFAIFFLALVGYFSTNGQATFTSNTVNGAWNAAGSWTESGPNDVDNIPDGDDVVVVQNGHTINITAAAACLSLTMNGTGRIDHTANFTLAVGTSGLTMNGTSQIVPTAANAAKIVTVAGTFSVSAGANVTIGGVAFTVNGAGPHTVVGALTLSSATGVKTFNAVSVSGTWTSTALNTTASLVFRNGLTNTGTFSANAASFTTASQAIAGNSAISFSGNVDVANTFTVTNNNSNTVTIGGTLTLTGNWTQGANSPTLALTGGTPFAGAGTFNASSNPNTVNYSGTVAQAVRDVAYYNLTVSGSNTKTWTLTANRTPGVGNNLTVQSGCTFALAGNFNLGVSGLTSISGIVSLGGVGDRTFTGSVTLNSPSSQWGETSAGIFYFGGDFTNNASSFGASTGNHTFNGAARVITGSTVTAIPTITFTGAYTNNGTITSATLFTVTGVSLTNNGTINATTALSGTGEVIQGAGATLNIGGASAITTLTASGAGNTVDYNGGAQTVKPITYGGNLTLSGSGAKTLTGVTTISGDFTLSGTATAAPPSALTIGGTFTLGATATFTAGSLTHTIAGDWISNGGTFTNTSSTINLNGTTQTIGGSSSTTFNKLALNGSGAKTFGITTTVADNLYVLSGVTINPGSITTHTTNTFTVGSSNKTAGTWGSTASAATFKDNAIFTAGTTGRLTVSVTPPAITYYSRQTGNWNATTTWSTVTYGNATNVGTFPLAGDIVNIGGGNFTVTVNVAAECASLSFEEDGGNSPTVTISGTNTLNVSGAVTIPGAGVFEINTMAVGAGTLNAASIAFIGDGGVLLNRHVLTLSTGTVTVSGDVTKSGTGSGTITFTNAGLLRLGGTFLNSSNGALTSSTGTVEYNGAAQTIGDFTYYNLTLSGSGNKTLIAPNDINGAVTIGTGTTLVAGAFTHTVGGDWINNGSFTHSGGTMIFDGTAQNIGGTTSTSFNNVELNGSGTKTFAAASFSAGYFAVGSGANVNLGGFTNHTANSLTLGGIGQTAGVWGGTGSGAANTNATYFGTSPTTSGRVTTATGGSSIYYTRADGNWNAPATWSNVTYNGAAAATFPTAGSIVRIGGGNWDVTVNTAAVCASLIYLGDTNFNTSVSINAGQSLTVSGAIILPNGGFTLLANFYDNTLAVGDGTLNAASIDFNDGGDFGTHALTINNGTATVSGNVTGGVAAALTTIDITGSGTLNLGGTFLNSSTAAFSAATNSTVNYNGTTQTISDFNYYNLTLSGSGTKTLSAATDINGTVTIGATTTLLSGAFTHTVGGNWVNNGSFTHSGGTITFDNGGVQSIGGTSSTTFNNIELNGTGVKTFGRVSTSAGSFSVGSGASVNLGGFSHTANSLTLGNIGQIAGVWGGTGSGAANTNATYFGTSPTTSGTLTTAVTGSSTFYQRATGLWNTPGTWSNVTYGGAASTIFPVAGDIVNIGGTGDQTVTVDGTSACRTVNFQSGTGNSPILSITTGTLTVSGAINLNPASNFSGDFNTLAVSGGTLSAGSIAFTTALFASNPRFTISTGTATINGDVTESGSGDATVTFTGAGTLRLRGAFLNSGNCTFTRSTGTVEYASTTVAQTIGDFTYNNLLFNNTSATAPQLTLSDDVIVAGTLTMTSGRVNLNSATLTLGNGAGAALARTASTTTNWFYNGTFARYWPATTITTGSGNVYGLFPMGTASASSYRQVAIASTVNPTGAGTFSVRHIDASGVTDLGPVFNDGGTNIVRKHNAQFVFATTATGGTFNINVIMTGLPATGSLSDMRLAVSNGPNTVTTVGTHLGATGSASNPTVSRTGISPVTNLAGDFRISTTNLTATPLPIELISFVGETVGNTVQLNWETASELNNDFFTVERSAGGEVFTSIGQMNGHGTTNQGSTYSLIDHNPIYGTAYYRLKQTDFDGTFTYSKVIDVTYEGSTMPVLTVFPNPSRGDEFNIKITGIKNMESIPVVMYDQLGRECLKLWLDVDKNSGTASQSFTFEKVLPQGMYLLKAGQARHLTVRFSVTGK